MQTVKMRNGFTTFSFGNFPFVSFLPNPSTKTPGAEQLANAPPFSPAICLVHWVQSLKNEEDIHLFRPPPFRTKTMAFSPNLARPRVQCFSIFAFTSSPGGSKCLFPSIVRVKAQVQIAFTHGKVQFKDPKMPEFIGEQWGVR